MTVYVDDFRVPARVGRLNVTEGKRQQAIAAGAVPITWREAGQQMVLAKEAWKAAPGGLACARTVDGKPPGSGDLWPAAAALYEIATARAVMR